MIVENTKKMETIRNVVATMAIEDMYLSREFVNELIKVSKGEKTSEQLRQEVIAKYARQ
ncbi:MAG: antitoxin VbhA family protein [Eubacterium sp.]|nr:antitoxin VbhA family protein [Eubacterium sp.]